MPNLALAALLVAVVGLLVAALSLGWQVSSWLLEGGRVRVRLLHGLAGPHGAAVGVVRRDHSPHNLSSTIAPGMDDVEVIGVAVTNVGRSTVRIDGFSATLKGSPFSIRPIRGTLIGRELPHRLESGETERWYLPLSELEALATAIGGVAGRRAARLVVADVELGSGDRKLAPGSLRLDRKAQL